MVHILFSKYKNTDIACAKKCLNYNGKNGEIKGVALQHRNDPYDLMQTICYYERQTVTKLKVYPNLVINSTKFHIRIKQIMTNISLKMFYLHCVRSVQIRSFFWSVFSCIRTEYGDLCSVMGYGGVMGVYFFLTIRFPYPVKLWDNVLHNSYAVFLQSHRFCREDAYLI